MLTLCATGCDSAQAISPDSPSVGGSSRTLDPIRRPPYVYIDQFDQSGHELRALSFDNASESTVDVTGLSVDVECARRYYFDRLDLVRVELLKYGCAELTTASPTSAEAAAQNEAKNAHRERWAAAQETQASTPSASPGAAPESNGLYLRPLWDYLGRNWIPMTSLLIAALGSVWLVRYIDRRRYELKVRAVLVGATAAGKSELLNAWRDDSSPNLPEAQSHAVTVSRGLEPMLFGKYTIYPTLVDTVGAKPSQLLDQMYRKRKRFKAKRILIVVVAPTRDRVANEGESIDNAFIEEQKGYMGVPMTVLGANRHYKPDLVVLFATKFDLVSQNGPRDGDGRTMFQEVDRLFRNHQKLLKSRCEEVGVPFRWIVGSAREGWGIQDLRSAVTKALVESAVK
jgi:hypothetical protein